MNHLCRLELKLNRHGWAQRKKGPAMSASDCLWLAKKSNDFFSPTTNATQNRKPGFGEGFSRWPWEYENSKNKRMIQGATFFAVQKSTKPNNDASNAV